MIGRLSNMFTTVKTSLYGYRALRIGCYLAIFLGLLLFWLYSGETEAAFVYNAF